MVVSTIKQKSKKRLIALLFIVCVICGLFLLYWLYQKEHELSDKTLKVNGQAIVLDVSAANVSREKGLSGRASLPKNNGMLFDFSDGGDGRCFWMKDMKFSIDIIWLDSEKKITQIASEVPANSYPQNFCSSDAPLYVLELSSGRAQELSIDKGDILKF